MDVTIKYGDQINALDLIKGFTVENDEKFGPYLREIYKVKITQTKHLN